MPSNLTGNAIDQLPCRCTNGFTTGQIMSNWPCVAASQPAGFFLFSKKFPASSPTGEPAGTSFKNQNNQKSSALASLNPCTVEVAETNARKEGIGSFVGSDMCCQLFLFMNQSLQHTPCMCVLNPIVSTFHH